MRNFRRPLCCLLSLLLLFSALSLRKHTAEADENSGSRVIVSLGDSYSSGEGIEPFYYQDEPNEVKEYKPDWAAHRSKLAWPGMLTLPGIGSMAEHRGSYWFFAAGSSAKTMHLENFQDRDIKRSVLPTSWHTVPINPQLSVFGLLGGKKADYVTITIGGNDADFSDIITTAAVHCSYLNMNSLKDKVDDVWNRYYQPGGIRDSLKKAYQDIRDTAGEQAKIIVAGYPGLLSQNGGFLFGWQEAQYIDAQVSKFNSEIRSLVAECYAEGIQIYYVSVEEDFYGHEAYTEQPYINGIILNSSGVGQTEDINNFKPVSDYSIHPNYDGARAYSASVQRAIDYLEELKRLGQEMPSYDASVDVYKEMIAENARKLLEEEHPDRYTTLQGYMNDVAGIQRDYREKIGRAAVNYIGDDFEREWISTFLDAMILATVKDVSTWKDAGKELFSDGAKAAAQALTSGSDDSEKKLSALLENVYGDFSSKKPRDIIQAMAESAADSIVIDLDDIESRMADGRFGSYEDAVAFIRIHQLNKMYFATAEMGIALANGEEKRGPLETDVDSALELLFKKIRQIEMVQDAAHPITSLYSNLLFTRVSKRFQLILDWLVENCYSEYTAEWKKNMAMIEEETRHLFLHASHPGSDIPVQYLPEIYPSRFERYEDNEGDTCIFNFDRQGLPGIAGEYYCNGYEGINGEQFRNGFEVWMARWNDSAEKSWVRTEYLLGGRYIWLSGRTGLIRSRNTTDFDTTIFFFNGDTLLASYHMTPERYQYNIGIDLTGVQKLTLYAEDNRAVKGGTSFALSDLSLTAVGEIPPEDMISRPEPTPRPEENLNVREPAADFQLQGTWKSVGSYGFGQAQPGWLIAFQDSYCNFYSPMDTYTFYKMNGKYYLEVTSLLGEKLFFDVEITDCDHIRIIYARNYVTELERK